MKEPSQKASGILENTYQQKIEELTGINEKLKREIAELSQTEKMLRASESMFKRAQEMGKVGSWEWDLINNKTNWSDELYKIFGVKPEQFDPDAYGAFLSCIHIDDRQIVEETIDKCINDKTDFNIEYRIVHPDGSIRDIHALGEVICNESGDPVKVIGTSQDITLLKQAEIRLKRSESIGNIGNWEYDIVNNRIIWSDQVYKLFGRDPELGPPTVEEEQKYYSEEDRNRLIEYAQEVIKTGKPVKDYEFQLNMRNGDTRIFMGSMLPVKNKEGHTIKLYGIFQDITKRKHDQLEIFRHLEFEKYISELASRFINLPKNKLDSEITKALKWMADYFEVERVTLLKLSEDKKELRTINLYRRDKIRTVSVINLDMFMPTIWPVLKNGNSFSWSVNDEIIDEASQEMKIIDQLGAKSVVIVPVMVGNRPEYVITIASLKNKQSWDKHLIPRIQFLGTLIVSVLQLTEGREKLKRKERSLLEAQKLSHVGDWQTDLTNNEVSWSEELYNILGYKQGEIKASRAAFLDRVHPDDRPLLEKLISNLRFDNQPFALDHRIVHTDGKIKYCQSLGNMRCDEENKPIYLHGIVQDITDRKLAEDALRKSEAGLASAQRIAHLGSWERSMLTNESIWSEEVYRIFGLDETNLTITYDLFLKMVHPDDRSILESALSQSLRNPEQKINIQFRIIRFDGIERIVQARGEVKLDENGEPVLIVGTVHDLTELKTVETETKQLRNQLTHLNRVNTVGNLASAIAHEINQPLAAILSNSQAALRLLNFDPPDLNEVREALTDIVSADKRAGEVIRRIRTLVKKEDIKIEPYNINQAIREVISLIRNETLIQNTMLRTDLDPKVPVLYGDHIQVQQVILNLFMNALEAVKPLPADKRQIDISTGINDSQFVLVSITDSGPGVEEENIDNIFDPFYTTKAKGMGMGLAVCYSIIENYGGSIYAENRAEGGARFSFKLPLKNDDK